MSEILKSRADVTDNDTNKPFVCFEKKDEAGNYEEFTYEEYDSLIMSEENTIAYIADPVTHELKHITKRGMEMFGLDETEDYIGKKCYKILQNRERPCPYCTNMFLREGEKYIWEHFNERTCHWVAAEDTLIRINGRQYRLEVARDIQEQKAKMRRLADRLSVEDILLDCVRALTLEADTEKAFACFLERLGRYYRGARAYIFEFDLKKSMMSNTHEWCSPTVAPKKEYLQNLPLVGVDKWIKAFETEGVFYANAADNDGDISPDTLKIMAHRGINSILVAPLYIDNHIVGFLGVDEPSSSEHNHTLLKATTNFVVEELKKHHLIKQLERTSYTDTLTGLYNRNKYLEALEHLDMHTPQSLGVVYIDVNGMKKVNDSYGHVHGDSILVDVAGILKSYDSRHSYRIGGDEFVLLASDISKDDFRKLLGELNRRFDNSPNCDVSIGHVWADGHFDINAVIAQADEQMYAEKQSYYRSALIGRKGEIRTGMASEVLREIEKGNFMVYYQPQLNIAEGELIGAEALIRKKNDNGEIIPPDKFIPYYELEGVIRHVDLFVFRETCIAMRKWMKEGFAPKISVNMSRVTLMETNIAEYLKALCAQYEIDPKYITLEVTESISKLGHEQLQDLFKSLTQSGFTISLDDFGSKYSNLSILNDLDFSTVKLDKTLVDQLVSNGKSRSIMRSIIQMCRDIHVGHVLAEGVETGEQLELLSKYGCEYCQGYYFSRPLPLDKFEEFIREMAKQNKVKNYE